MKRIALMLIALAFAAPATAKPVTAATLERQWFALDRECRGGPHRPGDTVCRKRDAVLRQIEARGVCWAYRDEGVLAYQYEWHDCRRAKPRPNKVA